MAFLASLTSWAVDLKDVAAVYPWQGKEVIMVLIGFVLWLAWHIWQIKLENETLAKEVARIKSSKEAAQRGVDSQD